MHMADALLSPAVGGVMCAISAGATVFSASKIKKDEFDDKKIPIMGIMGAFVFAAQMINFTIPGTGSSGHLGGGILLAATLGQFPAFLTLTAVLIIQALFFADGGLLALGCNVFNLAFVTCLIAYPLIFKPILKKGMTAGGITAASLVSSVVGLAAGFFLVVLQTQISGITQLPFATFAGLMIPIHLAIGAVEGLITAAVLIFVYKMRPEILQCAAERKALGGIGVKKVAVALLVLTVLTAGGLSLLASSYPDGLEWSIEKTAGGEELSAESEIHKAAQNLQEGIAIMPDYDYKEEGASAIPGTTTAGLLGAGITLAVAAASGFAIHLAKKRRREVSVQG
ncbi:MAG: energy-coupling factor ABC transporter permease [Christensenellales bacterium]|jgi:cobalt/nickel transport system permease protein